MSKEFNPCKTCIRECKDPNRHSICFRKKVKPEDEICCYFGPECQGFTKENCGFWNNICKCPQESINKERLEMKDHYAFPFELCAECETVIVMRNEKGCEPYTARLIKQDKDMMTVQCEGCGRVQDVKVCNDDCLTCKIPCTNMFEKERSEIVMKKFRCPHCGENDQDKLDIMIEEGCGFCTTCDNGFNLTYDTIREDEDNLVEESMACPICHERDKDVLNPLDGSGKIYCNNCSIIYDTDANRQILGHSIYSEEDAMNLLYGYPVELSERELDTAKEVVLQYATDIMHSINYTMTYSEKAATGAIASYLYDIADKIEEVLYEERVGLSREEWEKVVNITREHIAKLDEEIKDEIEESGAVHPDQAREYMVTKGMLLKIAAKFDLLNEEEFVYYQMAEELGIQYDEWDIILTREDLAKMLSDEEYFRAIDEKNMNARKSLYESILWSDSEGNAKIDDIERDGNNITFTIFGKEPLTGKRYFATVSGSIEEIEE
jgi:hypothetical protein